jgi:transcriptional regulator with XRE-family HTH domain
VSRESINIFVVLSLHTRCYVYTILSTEVLNDRRHMDQVAERLAELRERRALTLRELSDMSGVAADTINQIELGHRKARPSTLRKLARSLEIDVQEFYAEPALPKAEAPMEAGLAGVDPSSRLIYAEVLEGIAGLWAEELARGLYDRRTLGLKHMVGGIVAMNHEAAVGEDRQNFPPHFLEQLEAAEERFVAVEIQIWEAIEAADSEQAAPPDELAARREAREAKREELRQQLRGSKQARHA